jgi:hypothetical protein
MREEEISSAERMRQLVLEHLAALDPSHRLVDKAPEPYERYGVGWYLEDGDTAEFQKLHAAQIANAILASCGTGRKFTLSSTCTRSDADKAERGSVTIEAEKEDPRLEDINLDELGPALMLSMGAKAPDGVYSKEWPEGTKQKPMLFKIQHPYDQHIDSVAQRILGSSSGRFYVRVVKRDDGAYAEVLYSA